MSLAFGVAGLVGISAGVAVVQLSRLLFSILRSSYNEALRSMHQVSAQINSDSPGGWESLFGMHHVDNTLPSTAFSRRRLPAQMQMHLHDATG